MSDVRGVSWHRAPPDLEPYGHGSFLCLNTPSLSSNPADVGVALSKLSFLLSNLALTVPIGL